MSKYAIVDKESCIACGACNSAAPDIFDLDDDGIAEVIYAGDGNRGIIDIAVDFLEDLEEAIESCPTQCIQLASTPFA
ncbi:ferredoxin [Paenibacillus sp. sgz500958]|uniref:ferredoxin n=1 Tax=Paenibacillus sp. sgz500958 TaxID=3242475 RepID=UPI0036D2D22A